MNTSATLPPQAVRFAPAWQWSYLVPVLVAVLVVIFDRDIAAVLPLRLWQKLHLQDFGYKATLLLLPLAMLGWWVFHLFAKLRDATSVMLVIMVISMQTNGIKIIPGLDMLTLFPFVVGLIALAEYLRRPEKPLRMSGIGFFVGALLLLDLPYFVDLNLYGPFRFLINLISAFKAYIVAFVFIYLIRERRHLDLTIRAVLAVATVSALIGVGQILLNKFAGIGFSLVPEQHEMKPTFFGMVLRASGFTSWPQWLADFLIVALPFLTFRLLRTTSWKWRLGYLLSIAASLVAIFFTFTYASYFAVGVIALLFPFVLWPQRIIDFVLILLLGTVLAYLFGGLDWLYDHAWNKIISSSGMVERKTYLEAAFGEVTRNPWLGSGYYADEELSENFYRKRVHNTGMQAWVYLGLPGLVLFLGMMLTSLTQLWLLAFSRQGYWRETFQALGLGMIAMITVMFAEPNLTAPVTWFFLGLCQAAIMVGNSRTDSHSPSSG